MPVRILLLRRERALFLALCVFAGLASSCAVIVAIREIAFALTDRVAGQHFAWPVFIAALVVTVLGGLCSQVTLSHIGARIMHDLRSQVVSRIMHLPYETHERLGASHMHAILSEDVAKASSALGTLPSFVVCAGLVAFGFGYLLLLSPVHFVGVAAVLLVGMSVARYASARLGRTLREARTDEDEMQGLYRALIEGAKEFRLSAGRRQRFIESTFAPLSLRLASRKRASGILWGATVQWNNFVFFMLLAMAAVLPNQLSLGNASTLTTYALVLLLLRGPMMALMEMVPTLVAGKVALERLARFEQPQLPRERADVTEPTVRSLALRALRFRYPVDADEQPVSIGPIDLQLTAGKIVFVTGGNGSGKTTLAKLLSGLYAASEGSVLLNDVALGLDSALMLRRCVSAIHSDFFVMPFETAASARSPMLSQWIQLLGLEDKLSAAGGWQSAPRLSQGQRKRLALVNLLADDKPVCIFDEWAADQDRSRRELFYRRFLPELAALKKLVIVVTHDSDYFDVADTIVHMKDMQISFVKENEK
ncbi:MULTISPECIES: cyclic peptide export ABC transporter [unclassified Burkholderia]|uniref:cyclic peptide export ABC transporter n=1 Tax=unclassified Burkholderia TaxID=2613784 RepID=UPI0007522B32|nr:MULTISPECIES: cyclic peptide export ABC transporter [unclassified Burkholderia]KVN12732.1 superoxide dismutase [Burkholderia sp. MSMB1552]KWZ49422.1 superoxide dismutase [Burkholderia sp. MSMB1588]